MYELNQVSENCYYIQSPAKIGVVKIGGDEVCLIDSGSDKDAGKKALKILGANGWKLKVIYNTHSNADHIGGNAYLQRQTNCKIYAPGIECDFTNHPILEPSFLYGGFPPKDLRHKFLLAESSICEPLIITPQNTTSSSNNTTSSNTGTTSSSGTPLGVLLPDRMEIVPLSGHFFDMVGFRVHENDGDVVYLADCLSSLATLEKYQIGFIYDVASYLQTLEKVKTMEAKIFVPAHADATENIASLAQANIDKVNEIADKIISLCKEPINFESLLQKLFKSYNLTMTAEQYVLVGSTVKSYLSWLKDAGRLQIEFNDAMMLWRS